MNIRKVYVIFVLMIFLISCSNRTESVCEVISERNIKLHAIDYDIIRVDLKNTSLMGQFQVFNNKIVFFDHEFATANVLDKNFSIEKQYLGYGKGPNEISGIHRVSNFVDSSFVVVNSNWMIYLIDKNWNIKHSSIFTQNPDEKPTKQAIYFPHSDMLQAYEYESNCKSIKMIDKQTLLLPITTYGIVNEFGNYGLADKYYKNYFALGKVDINTGNLDSVFLNRPSVYLQDGNKYLANFNFFDFDVYDEHYWVSWEIDSIIYQYNYKNNTMNAFGCSGIDMRTDYAPYKSFEEHEMNFFTDREKYGFYTGIFYDRKTDMVFRTYYKGKNRGNGMQLYENNILIADIAVPQEFNVLGRIGNYIFASGLIDEYNSIAYLYRFSIMDSYDKL